LFLSLSWDYIPVQSIERQLRFEGGVQGSETTSAVKTSSAVSSTVRGSIQGTPSFWFGTATEKTWVLDL